MKVLLSFLVFSLLLARDGMAMEQRRVEPIGAPALSEEIEVIEIPKGSVCTGITYTVQGWTPCEDIGIPKPIQRPRHGDNKVVWTEPDALYYDQEVWPETPVEVAGTFFVEGRRMLRVRVSRQRWRGGSWQTMGTGVVEVATGLSFTPLFDQPTRAALASTPSPGALSKELLILAPPDLRDAWNVYAAQRRQQMPDWTVRVVGTDEIYCDYPFGSDEICRNAAESIHAYLRTTATPGATHVLLGGMWCDAAGEMPERHFLTGERLSLSNCVPGICACPQLDDDCGPVPADLFYACLDSNADGTVHPWDPDGDGVYLSASEAALCDTAADIVVGRFAPVPYDAEDGRLLTPFQIVTNYAAKVARGVGTSFAGTNRLGLASGCMQATAVRASTSLGRPHPEQAFFDGVPNVWDLAHPDSVTDGEWMTRETLRTIIVPHWPILEVESIHSGITLKATKYGTWEEALTAYCGQDLSYAICRSHGSETVVAGGNLTRDRLARATGLTLFNEFSVPCLAGSLSCTRTRNGVVYVLPSLGMATTSAIQGGALSGLYNAGYGWSDSFGGMTLSDGYSSTIGYLTAKNLFENADETFGLAVLHARQQYAAQYTPKGIRLFLLCEQLFYGDPSLGLPHVEKEVELAATTTVPQPHAFVSARVSAPEIALGGTAPLKIMDSLVLEGTNVVVTTSGGVGGRIAFAGESGQITLAGGYDFYVGGISNCERIVLSGGGKLVDVSGAGAALRSLASEGDGTNVLRCTTTGGLSKVEPIRVVNGWLRLETAEALGTGATPSIAVTNGGITWAASRLAGWDGDTEHLVRPIWLKDATLLTEGRRRAFWGRHSNNTWNLFTLHVAGTSMVSNVKTGGVPFGLVGTTTVELEEGSVLQLASPIDNQDSGRLVFTGTGRVLARCADSLAGEVEVQSGATLELKELPLPVTSLVVRAGSTLRIPASESGRHDIVARPGTLLIEEGARIDDLSGNRLTGFVVDGSFFEPTSTLRWKGGIGVWSDPAGWFDAVTRTFGPWLNGRTAIFDAASGSSVSNDLDSVETPSLVIASDTVLDGKPVRLESGTFTVPTNVSASVGMSLEINGEVWKYGAGSLMLHGDQRGLTAGGLHVMEGALGLNGVTAPGMTNLSAASGTFLHLRGDNVFTNAAACASLTSNALVCAEGPSTLWVEDFRPQRGTIIPRNLQFVVAPRDQKGYASWNLTAEGMLDYRGTLSLLYGRIDGSGTVRVGGLRSQSTYGAAFGTCRLELASENGVFPAFEDLSWGRGVFVFDGTTLAPTGSLVVSSATYPSSTTILYVDEGGITFDVPAGTDLVFGDENPTYLFGGDGGLVKRGEGRVSFTTVADQHEGPTLVEQGTYGLGNWTTLNDLRVFHGATVDLSDPYPTEIGFTNLVLEAGSRVELCVSEDGSDVLDVREGTLVLPTDGRATLEVTIASGTSPGLYDVLLIGGDVSRLGGLETRVVAPLGHQAAIVQVAEGLAVLVRPAATTIFLR